MTGRFVGIGAVMGLALASVSVAAAQEPWVGTWRVEGTPQVRFVEEVHGGWLQVELLVDAGPARCRAAPRADRLQLVGTIFPAAGIVGALEGRDAGPPLEVTGTVTRGRPTPLGEETADAVFFVEGREAARERWVRPGAPGLEVVALEGFGGGGLDPTTETLAVRVRVLGCAQRVSLVARVPEGERARRGFYLREGLDPRRVAATEPARLEPGEHLLAWDGRDQGPAGRVALAGAWCLDVQSVERAARGAPPVVARVTVPRPRALCVAPWFDPARHDVFPDDTLTRLRGDLAVRYAVAPTLTRPSRATLVDALARSAVGVIATHGHEARIALDAATEPVEWLTPADLPPGKPLRDVHALFVFSCRTGARDGALDLPAALVQAGVDVVVSSTATLLIAEARPYHDAIGVRLLGYGHPIRRAAKDAAKFAHDQVWGQADEATLRLWRGHPRRIRSVHDEGVLRFVTAPGVDAGTEVLNPPRHGRATN